MKKLMVIICTVCAAVVAVTALIYTANEKWDSNVVAYVDGEKIEYDEFMLIAGKKKFEIIKYFSDEYNAEYNKDFWNSSFNGENPSEKMKEEVLNELVPVKIQQKMAVESDLIESSSYSSMLDKLNTENAERKEKKENNMVVYGVTEYTPLQYYEDSIAKMTIALKNDLTKNYFKPDETELKAFYEENKDVYYKTVNRCEIALYKFREGVSEQSELENLRASVVSGFDMEAVIEAAGGTAEKCIIDSKTERLYSMEYPELMQVLADADEGYVSDIFYTENGAYFAKFVSVEKNVYKSYDDIKDNVEKMYVEELFKDYLNELVENAEIKKGAAYDNISFSGI